MAKGTQIDESGMENRGKETPIRCPLAPVSEHDGMGWVICFGYFTQMSGIREGSSYRAKRWS